MIEVDLTQRPSRGHADLKTGWFDRGKPRSISLGCVTLSSSSVKRAL